MKLKVLALVLLLVLSVSAVVAQDAVELTLLEVDGQDAQAIVKAYADAYSAQHPNVTFVINSRPGGADGDNLVKTRLATGEMEDVFFYNSGSLLQALHPDDTLVNLAGQPFLENIQDSFFPVVSTANGIYGVPNGTAMGGGIMYNKAVYAQLGLSIPKTWDEFVANNAVIKEAGITPVIASFGATWSSQLFVLADFFNVHAAVPTFADDYTNNKAKYASTPSALAGFQYLRQGFDLGWYQQDFATTTYEQALDLLANGKGAHYPMLTFATSGIAFNFPDKAADIGFFAQPGPSAESNGATVWMPSAGYIPKTSQHIDVAMDFLGFVASVEGTEVQSSVVPPNGPYVIKGATLPEDALPATKELAAYIDSGNSYPALEFVSPIKGPNLEQICVAVGTGQMTPEEAAANYDTDVERQAQQLGLPGW